MNYNINKINVKDYARQLKDILLPKIKFLSSFYHIPFMYLTSVEYKQKCLET